MSTKLDESKKLKQRRFYITNDDWKELNSHAAIDNISVSEFVRKKLNLGKGVKPKNFDKRTISKIDPELLKLIKNFTNNLNQIAKFTNKNKQIDILTIELLDTMSNDIKHIINIYDNDIKE